MGKHYTDKEHADMFAVYKVITEVGRNDLPKNYVAQVIKDIGIVENRSVNAISQQVSIIAKEAEGKGIDPYEQRTLNEFIEDENDQLRRERDECRRKLDEAFDMILTDSTYADVYGMPGLRLVFGNVFRAIRKFAPEKLDARIEEVRPHEK